MKLIAPSSIGMPFRRTVPETSALSSEQPRAQDQTRHVAARGSNRISHRPITQTPEMSSNWEWGRRQSHLLGIEPRPVANDTEILEGRRGKLEFVFFTAILTL